MTALRTAQLEKKAPFLIVFFFSFVHASVHNWPAGGPRGRVVMVADFIIALDHSIISLLWLVWVRAPHGSQVRQVWFYLRVCQVVVSRGTPVCRPTFWLALFDMSEIMLKGTLNWTKKKTKKTTKNKKKQLTSKRPFPPPPPPPTHTHTHTPGELAGGARVLNRRIA